MPRRLATRAGKRSGAAGFCADRLAGLRVLDLTRLLPGGYCTLLLADHGADVIKVEDTGAGDYARADPPSFASLNRGKRSIQLDLKSEGGRKAFLRLAASADVVVESFRPGVMDRLAWAGTCCEREPVAGLLRDHRLRAGRAAALARRARPQLPGARRRAGAERRRGGPPVQAAAQIADIAGGALMAAFGIMAALRSGSGQSWTSRWPTARCRCWRCRPPGCCAGGDVPRRGELVLGGRLLCYASTSAPTASCRSARWSRILAAFCRGVGREDLVAHQFDAPGSGRTARWRRCCRRGRARSGRRSTPSTTAAWRPSWSSTRSWADEQVAARGMVVEGLLATPVRLSRRPRTSAAAARPGSARTPPRCWARPATTRARWPRCASRGPRSDERRRVLRARSATGVIRATERTSGPWDPRHQHAGPPTALLTGLLERTAPRDDMVLARVTVEILGAVPIAEVEVSTTVERPGRSVELLAGEVRAEGRAVLRARAWRVLGSPVGTGLSPPVALPEEADAPPPQLGESFGYATRSSGAGRAGGGPTAGRRRSGRGCGSRSSRARSRRRASA